MSSCNIACIQEIAAGVKSQLELTPSKLILGFIGQFVFTYIVLWLTSLLAQHFQPQSFHAVSDSTMLWLAVGVSVASLLVYVAAVYKAHQIADAISLM